MQPDPPNADDRQGIIDAAYDCLYEPHSGPIPVAAILERAGLSTRAFYRHFASKDELFLAMLRQEADALAGRLDRIADELPGDPVEQLTAWVEMMFALASRPASCACISLSSTPTKSAPRRGIARPASVCTPTGNARSSGSFSAAATTGRFRWPIRSGTPSPSARWSAVS